MVQAALNAAKKIEDTHLGEAMEDFEDEGHEEEEAEDDNEID